MWTVLFRRSADRNDDDRIKVEDLLGLLPGQVFEQDTVGGGSRQLSVVGCE
jgi:hypothetical protein